MDISMDILIGEYIFRKMTFFRKLVGTTANYFCATWHFSENCDFTRTLYILFRWTFPKPRFSNCFYYYFDIWASNMTLEARASFFDTNLTRRTHPQHAESNKNKQLLRNSQIWVSFSVNIWSVCDACA